MTIRAQAGDGAGGEPVFGAGREVPGRAAEPGLAGKGEAEDVAFSLIRETDDPLALRASIGGRPEVGWYLVYRGDPRAVLRMLRAVLVKAEGKLAKGTQRPRGPQG